MKKVGRQPVARSSGRLAWGLLAFFAMAREGPAAASEPKMVRFDVERQRGAEDCPDADELRKAVVAQLGYDPFGAGAEDRVTVVFSRKRDGFHVSIARAGGGGAPGLHRELSSHADGCSELANSARLAISIAIDPQAYLHPPPASPPEVAKEPPPPAPLVVTPPAPPPADRPRLPEPPPPAAREASPRWSLGAGALAALGAAPVLTEGSVVHADARAGLFSLGAEGRFDLPVTRDHGVGTVSSNFILASLVPCAHAGALAGCLLASFGALHAKSTGYEGATSRGSFLAMVGARGTWTWSLGAKTSLVLLAELQSVPTRTTLTVDDQPVWATPAITGDLGLQIRLAL